MLDARVRPNPNASLTDASAHQRLGWDDGLGPSRRNCSDCRTHQKPGSLAFISKATFCSFRRLLRQLALFAVSVTSTQEEQSTLTRRSCLRSRQQLEAVPARVAVVPLAWIYICLKFCEAKGSSSPWLHARPEPLCGRFQELCLCLLHVRNVFAGQQLGSSRAHASTRCRTAAHLTSLCQGLL